MGRDTYSHDSYTRARETHASGPGPVTARAEQVAHATGKLDPLVDPAGYGVTRLSLRRFELQPNGLWLLTVGTPMPKETRVDTTGSMGGNVDVALSVLPHDFELVMSVLPGYDLQVATGIFGDVGDRFVLCRPQFEMVPDKIVQQLTLMVPERDGGDFPEDPDYGLFGGAYLVDAYINKIGLKGYDFTVSDAPGRGELDEGTLIRVFGPDVFTKVAENGHQIDRNPTTKEVVRDLLKRAHAFFLQVGESSATTRFWTEVFGAERVVFLPSTEVLPHVQAAIIGLTEGTLGLNDVVPFLVKNRVSPADARRISRSVANIPIGAQAMLPNSGKQPKAGDLFRNKTDLWPLTAEELATFVAGEGAGASGGEGEKPKNTIQWL